MHAARRADKDHHGLLTNAAPEGPREWPWLPGKSTPWPRFPSVEDDTILRHPPTLRFSVARQGHLLPGPPELSLSIRLPRGVRPGTLGHTAGLHRASVRGSLAWPALPTEEEEEEEAAVQLARRRTAPARGRTDSRAQKWPLLVPQTVRIAFIFLPFQYIQ